MGLQATEILRGSFCKQMCFPKGRVVAVGKSSVELLSTLPNLMLVWGLGAWGHHVRHRPSLPGNVLCPWLPQRCLRTGNRPSGPSWGPGQAGTVVPGLPVATMQQEPLSDDTWGRRERLVTQAETCTLILNKGF